MSVLVLGLNHRTASVDHLERLTVPPDRMAKALLSLLQRTHLLEAVVVSTCNRVEVYAHASRFHGGMADLRNFLCDWGGYAPEDLDGLTYSYHDESAASHLFSVATGLDSAVVGERQVGLQVKQAFLAAEREDACGRTLGALFRQALRVARRVRAETGLETSARSMLDVGLAVAGRELGDLRTATVLLVGAGKMGGMAARRLRDAAGHLLVVNRSDEKAARLAARVDGETLPLDRLHEGLRLADLVITSTTSVQPIIDRPLLESVAVERGGRNLFMLDLAVPRDITPECGELPGATLLDVDGIRVAVDGGSTPPEIEHARNLVRDEAARFTSWRRTMSVEPTVAAMYAYAEGIRASELERMASRLSALDERERAAVEQLTRGIVKTLLHQPVVRLKEAAEAHRGEFHAQVVRELFDLPE